MRQIPWNPGNQYEVVTISIDPKESYDLARQEESDLHRTPAKVRRRAGIFWPITRTTRKSWPSRSAITIARMRSSSSSRIRGDFHSDAGGQDFALPLRRAIPGDGCAFCAGGGERRAVQHDGRKNSAVLLSLRSESRRRTCCSRSNFMRSRRRADVFFDRFFPVADVQGRPQARRHRRQRRNGMAKEGMI